VLDATVRDAGVYVRPAATLVVADLHVGMDEASEVEFPMGERRDLSERLAALLERFEPEEVVFAGDVLHRFDRASLAVDESFGDLVDACRAAGARPVVVRGNHDTVLSQVWDGDVHDAYALPDTGGGDGSVVVCHGHEEPSVEGSTYVIGHDHPAISIEGQRRPCFLYGEGSYRGADVLICPAFNRLAAGAEVNGMYARDFQSPLVTNSDDLRPIVYDTDAGEALTFPPLGRFRRLL
jgi:putative SbcD/Mre11-related phosphoesterase